MPVTPGTNVISWSKLTCDMRDGAMLHFVPHHKNDYVPHVLKHHVLASYSVIGILLKTLLIVAPTVLPAAAVYSSALTAGNVIKLTNVARADAGRSALHQDSRLDGAARAKAGDILAKQYFAHTSPEGKTPWDWIRASGYDYRHAGENLAIHFFTAEGAHDGWMASPTHRANIVDPRYADIGVGVEQGKYEGYDTVVVVQMFGILKSAAAAGAGSTTAVETAPVAAAPSAPTAAPVPAPETAPAPAVAAAPTQQPPASKPAVAAAEEPPVVDESKVSVLPTPGGYEIKATIEDAERVQAYLGTDVTTLEKSPSGEFVGLLRPSEPVNDTQYLFVGATAANGETAYQPVAAVAPSANTAQLYAGNGGAQSGNLMGFQVTGLEDAVRRFYFFAALFLMAALAAKVAINFHVQRHSVIAHSLFVIGLFAVLTIA